MTKSNFDKKNPPIGTTTETSTEPTKAVPGGESFFEEERKPILNSRRESNDNRYESTQEKVEKLSQDINEQAEKYENAIKEFLPETFHDREHDSGLLKNFNIGIEAAKSNKDPFKLQESLMDERYQFIDSKTNEVSSFTLEELKLAAEVVAPAHDLLNKGIADTEQSSDGVKTTLSLHEDNKEIVHKARTVVLGEETHKVEDLAADFAEKAVRAYGIFGQNPGRQNEVQETNEKQEAFIRLVRDLITDTKFFSDDEKSPFYRFMQYCDQLQARTNTKNPYKIILGLACETLQAHNSDEHHFLLDQTLAQSSNFNRTRHIDILKGTEKEENITKEVEEIYAEAKKNDNTIRSLDELDLSKDENLEKYGIPVNYKNKTLRELAQKAKQVEN